MSIRDNLIQSFTPHVRGDYTYEELLAIKAAGKDVPDHWITQAFAEEQAEEQQSQMQAAIAADLKAQEDAHAAKIKANYDKHAPIIREKLSELDDLRAEEAPAREAAREAVKAYFQTVRNSAAKYGEVARIIRNEFGPTIKDDDGNPLPGQTGLGSTGEILFDGEELNPPGLTYPWRDKIFRHPYFI